MPVIAPAIEGASAKRDTVITRHPTGCPGHTPHHSSVMLLQQNAHLLPRAVVIESAPEEMYTILVPSMVNVSIAVCVSVLAFVFLPSFRRLGRCT